MNRKYYFIAYNTVKGQYICFGKELNWYNSWYSESSAHRFDKLDEIKDYCEKSLLSYETLDITLIRNERFVVQKGE